MILRKRHFAWGCISTRRTGWQLRPGRSAHDGGRRRPRPFLTFRKCRPESCHTFQPIRAYFETSELDALRLGPTSTQGKNDVQVHFSLACCSRRKSSTKLAQLELEKADALQPRRLRLSTTSAGLSSRWRNAKSELALNRALKLKPIVEAMYLSRRRTRRRSRLWTRSIFLHAHKLAPGNIDVIFLMAQISMSQNYFEDAIPLLESGIQIAPQRADLIAASARAISWRARSTRHRPVHEVAEDRKLRALLFVSGTFLQESREVRRSEEIFREGIKLDPHDATCLFNLGFIAERQEMPLERELFSAGAPVQS